MNRREPVETSRLCLEKLRRSRLFGALFALIRAISSRRALDPELIRGSLNISDEALATVAKKRLFVTSCHTARPPMSRVLGYLIAEKEKPVLPKEVSG